MSAQPTTAARTTERLLLAIVFTAISAGIITVFSPIRPMLSKSQDPVGRLGLIVALTAAVLWLRTQPRLAKYGELTLGLLILAITVTVDYYVQVSLLDTLHVDGHSAKGYAIQKIVECATVVLVISGCTLATGGTLGSIYLQRGRWKQGLAFGLAGFALMAGSSVLVSGLLFKAEALTWARISQWLPWMLAFVLANGVNEELMFRGLFLRKLEPFFGRFVSNLLIALSFTALHGGATYTSDMRIFLVVLVPLALAWGHIMQRTDALWGSALFHAGADIPIVLGIFSGLP